MYKEIGWIIYTSCFFLKSNDLRMEPSGVYKNQKRVETDKVRGKGISHPTDFFIADIINSKGTSQCRIE